MQKIEYVEQIIANLRKMFKFSTKYATILASEPDVLFKYKENEAVLSSITFSKEREKIVVYCGFAGYSNMEKADSLEHILDYNCFDDIAKFE